MLGFHVKRNRIMLLNHWRNDPFSHDAIKFRKDLLNITPADHKKGKSAPANGFFIEIAYMLNAQCLYGSLLPKRPMRKRMSIEQIMMQRVERVILRIRLMFPDFSKNDSALFSKI